LKTAKGRLLKFFKVFKIHKMKFQKFLLALLFVSLLTLPLAASAQGDASAIVDTIYNIVDLAVTILVAVCTLMVLYGGFVILTSQGSPDKVGSGKSIIVWAAGGYIVAALAYAIAAMIEGVVAG
jgi:hypothetical protein